MQQELISELLSREGSVFFAGTRGAYCMGWFEPGRARVKLDESWLTVTSDDCRLQMPLASLQSIRLHSEHVSGATRDRLTVQFLDRRSEPRFSVLLPDGLPEDDTLVRKLRAADLRSGAAGQDEGPAGT